MIFPVSANSLIKTPLLLKNRIVKNGSLFPFFDLDGSIIQLMVIFEDSGRIFMIHADEKLVKLNWRRRLIIQTDADALASFSKFSESAIRGLFHYDPFWVLNGARFRNHWALALLKNSNCENRFPEPVESLFYSPNLTELKMILLKSGPLNISSQSANLAEMVAEPRGSTFSDREKVSLNQKKISKDWQLEPIWQDWQKLR